MKLHSVLLSLAIAYLLLQLMAPVQEPIMELTLTEEVNTCICFEYFYDTFPGEAKKVFQTCEIEALDELSDSTLTIFTFELPCQQVFAGARQVHESALEISVAQVD